MNMALKMEKGVAKPTQSFIQHPVVNIDAQDGKGRRIFKTRTEEIIPRKRQPKSVPRRGSVMAAEKSGLYIRRTNRSRILSLSHY